jgi:hypothetical protein
MNSNKLSNLKLIIKGWWWVNIPITLIMLIIWYCFSVIFEINNKVSLIIGSSLGWIYWEFMIKKWVKWALDKNVEPNRLLKVGQLSLLLWNNRQINKVLNEKK